MSLRKYLVSSLAIVSLGMTSFLVTPQSSVNAHCQIPCGIYDDAARIERMLEDTTTIGKAVDHITALSAKSDPASANQATRWIVNKEDHAAHIITVVSEYFLTQKVKEVQSGEEGYQNYLEHLAMHHRVMRAAMKTKQTVDPDAVRNLRQAIEALGKLYK